jgi:hypothetical protein
MNLPIRRPLFTIGAATVLLGAFAAVPTPALAAPASAGPVYAATDLLARRLAGTLTQNTQRKRIAATLAAGPADPTALAVDGALNRAVRTANDTVTAAKGLPAGTAVLQVRLAHPGMAKALGSGATPVVAAAPTDDEAGALTGYEPSGRPVAIDTGRIPDRPVLLVEVDTARALVLGAEVVRQQLAGHRRLPAAHTASGARSASGGYWATRVNDVRLSDDEEPWFKGDAEIFGLVGGFGLDGVATADVVQMPYLNEDGTTYHPNQLLVHFRAYKYNLADVVLMEDDGDTNYRQLAQAIVTALLMIVDLGAYAPLVDALLAAIPDDWYSDDPDYVDSWYTLATTSSGRLNGAAGNGWMQVSPYWVEEL